MPAIVESRVIPYGVDRSIFRPANKQASRAALDLDPEACVLLFAANGIRRNAWKDYPTMREAVKRIAERHARQKIIFLTLGDNAPAESIGRAEVRFIPFQSDPASVARYCQAADVYIHAARADTFPNSVLEALACGTPVIATAVGGISEQVHSLTSASQARRPARSAGEAEKPTGVLVPLGDAEAMADAACRLLGDRELLEQMGRNAAEDACKRFDLQRHADDYLEWYTEILDKTRHVEHRSPCGPPRRQPREVEPVSAANFTV